MLSYTLLTFLWMGCFGIYAQEPPMQAISQTPKAPGTFSNNAPQLNAEPPITNDIPSEIYGTRSVDLPFYRLFHGNMNFFSAGQLNTPTGKVDAWGSENDNANQSACGIPDNAFSASKVAIHPYFLQYANLSRYCMQDVCISYWKEDGTQDMMLKVTDICTTDPNDPTHCASPVDIKVERSKAAVMEAVTDPNDPRITGDSFPEQIWWFFTKCWDDGLAQPAYQSDNWFTSPPLPNNLNWSQSTASAQYKLNQIAYPAHGWPTYPPGGYNTDRINNSPPVSDWVPGQEPPWIPIAGGVGWGQPVTGATPSQSPPAAPPAAASTSSSISSTFSLIYSDSTSTSSTCSSISSTSFLTSSTSTSSEVSPQLATSIQSSSFSPLSTVQTTTQNVQWFSTTDSLSTSAYTGGAVPLISAMTSASNISNLGSVATPTSVRFSSSSALAPSLSSPEAHTTTITAPSVPTSAFSTTLFTSSLCVPVSTTTVTQTFTETVTLAATSTSSPSSDALDGSGELTSNFISTITSTIYLTEMFTVPSPTTSLRVSFGSTSAASSGFTTLPCTEAMTFTVLGPNPSASSADAASALTSSLNSSASPLPAHYSTTVPPPRSVPFMPISSPSALPSALLAQNSTETACKEGVDRKGGERERKRRMHLKRHGQREA